MPSKAKMPNIVGIGEVVFDILPDSRKLGGAPVDFLKAAVKYGAKGELISAIGADDLGREVISELNKFEIKPVLAVTPYPTGKVLIFNKNDGYVAHILENVAWDYIPFTKASEDAIQAADAIYFDTLALRNPYSRGSVLDLIEAAPRDIHKFFDINLRKNYFNQEIIQKLLNYATILKLNVHELDVLRTMFKLKTGNEDACLALKDLYGLKYIILTNSTKESMIWGDNDFTLVQNNKLQQTFAFGAGNIFAGVFLSSILKGEKQKKAHELANAEAAAVCLTLEE